MTRLPSETGYRSLGKVTLSSHRSFRVDTGPTYRHGLTSNSRSQQCKLLQGPNLPEPGKCLYWSCTSASCPERLVSKHFAAHYDWTTDTFIISALLTSIIRNVFIFPEVWHAELVARVMFASPGEICS